MDPRASLRRLRELGSRAFLARWGVALFGLLVSLGITARTHSFFMQPVALPMSNDEGYITAIALRMVKGHWLPYVDGVSQRGPITYWLCTLAMSIGGLFNWAALRWLSLGIAFGTLALIFLLALELFSPFAAGIAVLVETYFVTYELTPWDGLGYNGELVAMPFVLLSALLVARTQLRSEPRPRAGHRRRVARREWYLLSAGVLAACAGLSKQVTLTHIGPAVLWLLVGPQEAKDANAAAGSRSGRLGWLFTRGWDFVWYSAGLAMPFVVVLTRYLAAGHFRDFIYYFQQYGRDVFMAPLTRQVMRDKIWEELDKYFLGIAGLTSLTLIAVARATRATFAAPRGARLRTSAPVWFALLHLLVGAAGASFTWRFFGHYFIQLYPFVGLVAGYAVSEPFETKDDDALPKVISGAVVVLGATALLLIANATLHRNVGLRHDIDRWYRDPHSDPIVRYVVEKTTPADTIFVWGFRSETYVSAQRYPASRYVYTVYPSGVVPWFPATPQEEESRVVPGSRELLLKDLEESKPEVIVDAGRSMFGRYMYEIPILRIYLDQHYCFARNIDGEPVYLRRHTLSCPRPDY